MKFEGKPQGLSPIGHSTRLEPLEDPVSMIDQNLDRPLD